MRTQRFLNSKECVQVLSKCIVVVADKLESVELTRQLVHIVYNKVKSPTGIQSLLNHIRLGHSLALLVFNYNLHSKFRLEQDRV